MSDVLGTSQPPSPQEPDTAGGLALIDDVYADPARYLDEPGIEQVKDGQSSKWALHGARYRVDPDFRAGGSSSPADTQAALLRLIVETPHVDLVATIWRLIGCMRDSCIPRCSRSPRTCRVLAEYSTFAAGLLIDMMASTSLVAGSGSKWTKSTKSMVGLKAGWRSMRCSATGLSVAMMASMGQLSWALHVRQCLCHASSTHIPDRQSYSGGLTSTGSHCTRSRMHIMTHIAESSVRHNWSTKVART